MFLSWRVRTPAQPIALPFLLVGALLVAACSPSGGRDEASPIDDGEAVVELDGPPTVSTVTGSVAARVGPGRALAAAAGAGTLLVATTTGLHVFAGVGSPGEGVLGEPAASLPTPAGGPVEHVALSPDGTTAVVGNAEITELWALAPAAAEPGRIATVERADSAGFGPPGHAVVVRPEVVEVLDAATGEAVERYEAPASATFGALAVAADGGSWMVPVLGRSGHRALWSAGGSPAALVDLPLPTELSFGRVVVAPDGAGALIELWSEDLFDGVVASWRAAGGLRWSTPITATEVWDARPGGGLVVTDGVLSRSVADDGTERALPDAGGDGAAVVVHALASDRHVTVLHDGSRLLVGPDGARALVVPSAPQPAVTTTARHDRTGLAVVDALGRVELLDELGAVVAVVDRYAGGAINDLALSTDGALAVATTTGAVTVLDSGNPSGGPTARLDHPEGNVDSVAFSPDGRRLATGIAARRSALAFDDTIALWDLAAATRTTEIGGESEDVPGCSSFTNRLRWSPDGSFVVAVSHDFTVLLLDPATSQVRRELPPHAGPVLDVALSPDGRRLATSANDSTLRIWDTASGDLVAEHDAAIGGYRSLAFVDGSTVLGADLSGRITSIDVDSGRITATFEAVKAREAQLVVSPDGSLAVAGDGATVRVWSTSTGAEIGRLDGHSGAAVASTFTPDGGGLIVGSADGTVVFWDLTLA